MDMEIYFLNRKYRNYYTRLSGGLQYLYFCVI
nr:MAG TPA: hypothetical protein [Caudoviricetes sp.]